MSSHITTTRICEHCGNKFSAKTTVTRFCGTLCTRRAYKSNVRKLKIERSEIETASKKIEQNIVAVENREILNVEQAAKFIGVSTKAMYDMIRRGRVSAGNLGLRMIRIKRDELVRFIDLPEIKTKPTETKQIILESNEPLTRDNCYSVAEIVAKFGVKKGIVYNLLRKHEIAVFRVHKEVFLYKKAVDSLLHPSISGAGNKSKAGSNYYSVQEAMAKYGVNRDRIYTVMKVHKIPKVKKGKQVFLSAAMIDLILGKAKETAGGVPLTPENCYTLKEIERKFCVGNGVLYRLLKKNKIPKFTEGAYTYLFKPGIDEMFKRIAATRNEAEAQDESKKYYSVADVMERFGKTYQQVCQTACRCQVPKIKVRQKAFYLKTAIDEIFKDKKGGVE